MSDKVLIDRWLLEKWESQLDQIKGAWHVSDEIATVLASHPQSAVVGVLDGWRLVPVEPTPEMAAQTAYNGTHYSDPFDFEDFKKDYVAMLAAAPANPGWIVELPLESYGCVAADNVKESLVATGVPYK